MRSPRTLAALGLVATLALTAAACGDDSSSGSAATTAAAADTTAAAAGGLPVVTGDLTAKPTIEIPDTDPPTDLVVKVLTEGDGDPVAKGDVIEAQYVGQVWKDGTQFDASWDRGQAAQFPVGVGRLITAWDEGLVGVPYGSRVLIVAPPDYGYGAGGNPQAGIAGDDTLVFVVDLVQKVG
jgi:peptidylprolyl isomerase